MTGLPVMISLIPNHIASCNAARTRCDEPGESTKSGYILSFFEQIACITTIFMVSALEYSQL
jgi:hypothetical protein